MNCIVRKLMLFFFFFFCVFELSTIDFIRIWRRGLSASAFLQNHQKEKNPNCHRTEELWQILEPIDCLQFLGLERTCCLQKVQGLEINNGLSDSQIPLDGPR